MILIIFQKIYVIDFTWQTVSQIIGYLKYRHYIIYYLNANLYFVTFMCDKHKKIALEMSLLLPIDC